MGILLLGWSERLLAQTCKGITNSNAHVDEAKDPIRPQHLDIMYSKVDMASFYTLTILTSF